MKITQHIEQLKLGQYDAKLQQLTCSLQIDKQKQRYLETLQEALQCYGDHDAYILSAPGRTEVGGNHTDHQLGRVLAASVNMDIIAVVIPTSTMVVEYHSRSFNTKDVDLTTLQVQESEKNTSESLIRGIAHGFVQHAYQIGGFKAYAHSEVLPGSGISSSAAFEVLIGTIFNHLYNEAKIDSSAIAKIGQYAENEYFGKPCGLLDQMACSTGGFVMIDFKEKNQPIVEPVSFDFAHSGLSLVLVDTKGNHADLSDEYGKMPSEMKMVAKALGKEVLSQVTKQEILDHLEHLHQTCSDRAILRALHFVNETDRVIRQVNALKNNDLETFKKEIIASGYSSYMYLQNVIAPNAIEHQNLALALGVSEQLLANVGAYRVHGGGFAGTIQAFVPTNLVETYIHHMEALFGTGCCYPMAIRPVGGTRVA